MTTRLADSPTQNDIDALLDAIRRRYGYDFSQYAQSSLRRRLDAIRVREGVADYDELTHWVLNDRRCLDRLLAGLSVSVTEMFRDPPFWCAVKDEVIPVLKTFPFVKIWHAGCATGEEVYSLAILLHEADFLSRATLYATDFSHGALAAARAGIYSAERIARQGDHYCAAGGAGTLTEYFTAGYGRMKVADFLKERVTFAYHNLATDGVFGEMNLNLCRNVMIYFASLLKDRALCLFAESLRHGGFLGLGTQESLDFTSVQAQFDPADFGRLRLYRRR